jgi:trimeric autotransporter adhesin
VEGASFSYMSGNAAGTTGNVWTGMSSAGVSYNGIGATSNRLIATASGVEIDGSAVTLKSANGVDVSSGKIINLADGTLSAKSTDAVNGSPTSRTPWWMVA